MNIFVGYEFVLGCVLSEEGICGRWWLLRIREMVMGWKRNARKRYFGARWLRSLSVWLVVNVVGLVSLGVGYS